MRPEILFPLYAEVTTLPGIGPRTARHLATLAGPRILDLLWHLPTGLIDRRFAPRIAEAPHATVCTITVTVMAHEPPSNRRRPYRVLCGDESGVMLLVYFNAQEEYLRALLPIGQQRTVSGRVEHYHDQVQMPHPDHVVPPAEADSVKGVEPVYRLTAGLNPRPLRRAIAAALDRLPDLPEWGNEPLLKQRGWSGWKASLLAAHAPRGPADTEPGCAARQRLAYDELLANQLALALVRHHQKRRKGRPIKAEGKARAAILDALPFTLTGAQTGAIAEIAADMADGTRMLRLLQGDVGSGKTLVALMAMADAVETGAQAALMAPTEILARQHLATIEPLAKRAGIRVAALTGRDKGRARDALLAAIAAGSVDIVVGTHALFQESVRFRDLALAVIDEQHRFGVHQRVTLGEKGAGVDTLVMSATPIPRTLTMTVYGDLDVSRLRERPPGRKRVDTRALPATRLAEVIAAAGRVLETGAKLYWVCPLVAESESVDAAAAEARFRELETVFPGRVGLLHGRMKPAEKDAVMAAFRSGPLDLLVATTVIEVGVDVPEATVMVIEHAERFGLAQLHQLRGRIGRGTAAARCLLLYQPPLTDTARARLQVLRDTDDGFVIAEEDLRLRGAGELLGTRQSGLPTFRVAELAHHGDILDAARDDARLVMRNDPGLDGPRGRALRIALYLFERDTAIRYLRSG